MTVNYNGFSANLAVLTGLAKSACALSGGATYPALAVKGHAVSATEVQDTLTVLGYGDTPAGSGAAYLSGSFVSVGAFATFAYYHYVRTSGGSTGAYTTTQAAITTLNDLLNWNSPYLLYWTAGATISVNTAVKVGRRTSKRIVDVNTAVRVNHTA